jgi:hypothetical protein
MGIQRVRFLDEVHSHPSKFRVLLAEGNTPTSCLVLYYEHTVATMVLLELRCLEEEEDLIDPYSKGPGPLI